MFVLVIKKSLIYLVINSITFIIIVFLITSKIWMLSKMKLKAIIFEYNINNVKKAIERLKLDMSDG